VVSVRLVHSFGTTLHLGRSFGQCRRTWGWTRGVCFAGDFILVGVSALRGTSSSESASIAVLDRDDLHERGRIELPVRTVYGLLPCPEPLISGLRVGAQRGSLKDTGSLVVQSNELLADEECMSSLALESVRRTSDNDVELVITVTNTSGTTYSSIGVYPVRVGVRSRKRRRLNDIARTDLMQPIMPGESSTIRLKVRLGKRHVRRLEVSLVQESVKWFCDVDVSNRVEISIPRRRVGGKLHALPFPHSS